MHSLFLLGKQENIWNKKYWHMRCTVKDSNCIIAIFFMSPTGYFFKKVSKKVQVGSVGKKKY